MRMSRRMGLLGGGALTPVKIVLQSGYSEGYFSYAGVQYATKEGEYGLRPPVSANAFRGDDLTVGISTGTPGKPTGKPTGRPPEEQPRGEILKNGVTVVEKTNLPVSYSMTVPSDVLIVVSRTNAGRRYTYTARIITADATPLHTINISGGNIMMGMNVRYLNVEYVSGEILVPDGDAITIYAGYMGNAIILNGETVASGQNTSYEMVVTADTTIAVSGSSVVVTTK